LCISVETRLAKGVSQSGLKGLFNQYELIYILADERDVIRLRTNFRKEDVYLYQSTAEIKKIRLFFLKVVTVAHQLEEQPKFYNTLVNNCFTSLLRDFSKHRSKKLTLDYRLFLNGLFDQMAYENGLIKTDGLSFPELKKKHHINQYIENDPDAIIDFSKKIRPF